MKSRKIFFFFIVVVGVSRILHPLSLFAQKNFTLNILLVDSIHQNDFDKIKKQLFSQKTFRDSVSVQKEIQQIIFKLNDNGYLAAGFDAVKKDSLSFNAKLFLGEKYEWAHLGKGNVDESFFSGTGFSQKVNEKKAVRYDQLKKLQDKIISNCENNGYPFASVKLDSISINNNFVEAKFNLTKNRFVKMDSVLLQGSATIAHVYVYNYINIKPGDAYNEVLLSRISNRMRELSFLREEKSSEILFEEKITKLILYLANKKASQFDGVVGVLPDNDNPGKVNLTGEVHLKLQNQLKRGEVIELNWKSLPVKTQDLKVHLLYPFILNSPIGVDAGISLYKKDTTYLDVQKNLGVQYLFSGNNYMKVFTSDKESSLISSAGLKFLTALPPYADVDITSYGLGGHFENLDYRINPRTGFLVDATASAGNRRLRKNNDINPALYDSLKLVTAQYHLELSVDYFLSLSPRQVIDIGNKSAYLYNENIFTNELFRIGGLKSLRGFDEESIYASAYTIGKIEYRYLLEQNSFLFAFVNMAYYENKSRGKNIFDTPYGFGTGINFETKLGIMSVSYALGKEFNNPVYFRNAKVHFGIVNYF